MNHSGGGDTNILIQIDGIPSQLLIAVAAIEVMLKTKNKTSALEVYREDLADHLVTFLTKHQLTPVLKELFFHLLAKVLRRNFIDYKMILQPRVEGLLQSLLVEISSLQRNYQSRLIVPTYMQALFEVMTAWVQTFPVAKGKNLNSNHFQLKMLYISALIRIYSRYVSSRARINFGISYLFNIQPKYLSR